MKKILFLDDDEDTCNIINLALKNRYIIKIVNNGREVKSLYENFLPDLILVDYFVGQRQAPEIIQNIRNARNFNGTPFILFSGHPNINQLALEMGVNTYLAKPFQLTDLYNCVTNILTQQKEDIGIINH